MNFLITGAGSGVGFQTVMALCAESGHRVVALSRNQLNLQKLQQSCMQLNPESEVFILAADLRNLQAETIRIFFRENNLDHLDGLVNNAGLLINKPFEMLTDEDFHDVYETNLFAPVRLIRNLLPYLKNINRAHVVNIGSLGGFQGSSKFSGLSAYSSSKAALACLTECLAVELAPDHIAVNALALGAVDTVMLQSAFPGYAAPVTAAEMGRYVADFVKTGHHVYNGKVLPVALASV